MIDPVHRRRNCVCDQCRAKRSQLLRHDKSHARILAHRNSIPMRNAKARLPVCDMELPTERYPDAITSRYTVALPTCMTLNHYPTEKSPEVLNSMQFFLEVFTNSIHPYVDIPDGWNPRGFWEENLSYAVADPMWFHGTIAFAAAMKQKAITGTSKKSEEVMKYSARAIAGLRDRLALQKTKLDDLSILTIISLMSADVVNREVSSWKAHIDGLDRMLFARGGLESLGSNEYVRHKVIGFQLFWLYKQMSLGTAPEFATYPDHPFPPDLCTAISKMPEPFSDLALKGCFSVELIKAMAPILGLSSKFAREGSKQREDVRRIRCLAYDLEELFTITDLSQVELLIVLALIDYSVTLDIERRQHWLIVGSCQINATRISFTGFDYDPSRHDLLLWVGATWVACGEPTLQTAKLAHKILNRCGREQPMTRSDVLDVCWKFAWDDVLTEKLDTRFDFEATPLRSSSSPSSSSDNTPGNHTLTPNSESSVKSATPEVVTSGADT